MKKSLKILIITFLICFCVPIIVGAEATDNVISFDEFYSTLKSEYAKYNTGFEISNPNYDFCYTKEYLEEQLEIARDFCEGLEVTVTVCDAERNNIGIRNRLKNKLGSIEPYAMMDSYSWTANYEVRSSSAVVPGYIIGKVSVYGDVNLQNSLVASVNSYQRPSDSLNVESHSLSVSTSINNGANIYVTFTGNVTFAWTDPSTNSVFRSYRYGPYWGESFRAENYVY